MKLALKRKTFEEKKTSFEILKFIISVFFRLGKSEKEMNLNERIKKEEQKGNEFKNH